MNSITQQVHVDADRSAVWAILEDVGLLPDLSASTVSVDGPDRLESVGQQFRQTVELAGRRFTSDWTVEEIEPGRRLVISGSALPGTRYRMIEELDPDGHHDDATVGTEFRLVMQYRLPFGPLGRLAARLGVERRAEAEAARVVDGVRRLAERQGRR